MKAKLQKELLKKYPEFFDYLSRDQRIPVSDDPFETAAELLKQKTIVVPIQFGFEVDDGWYMLLDVLIGEIKQYLDNENENRKTEIRSKFWRKWIRYFFNISYNKKGIKKFLEWFEEKLPKGIEPMTLHLTQVKEKYGGLSFYYNGGDDTIYGMVRFAEELSYHICENCGSTTNVSQTEGWIKTLCDKCMIKYLQKNLN